MPKNYKIPNYKNTLIFQLDHALQLRLLLSDILDGKLYTPYLLNNGSFLLLKLVLDELLDLLVSEGIRVLQLSNPVQLYIIIWVIWVHGCCAGRLWSIICKSALHTTRRNGSI